jgi:flagellar protein FliO/FliZ
MRSITATRGVALGGVLTALPVPVAHAAGGESTPLHLSGSGISHAAAAGSGGTSILRTIVALVIVIAVIYAVARILRAVKGRGGRASGEGLTQIATLPLGAGRSLALVRSGRDIVLVGIAEQGVTPIKTYTEAEARAVGIDVPPEAAPDYDQAERPLDKVVELLRRMTVRS